MIKILLVDDHKMIRDALKYYFKGSNELDIVEEAEDGSEGLERMETRNFDLLIVDIRMPGMDGQEMIEKVRSKYPDQKILVLSMFDDPDHIKSMVSLKINGYVLKNAGRDELLDAIRRIASGEVFYSSGVLRCIQEIMSDPPDKPTPIPTGLTFRELEVLSLILKEYSNQEIADKLFVSVRTVEGHKRNLLARTGSKNLAGLVLYAVEHNLA